MWLPLIESRTNYLRMSEVLKLLNPKTASLERTGFSPDSLKWEDVSAALAQLSDEASLFARIVYLDEKKHWQLIKKLIPRCRDLGYEKSTNRLIQLLFLALGESKKGNRCQKCMGVGTIATFKCENCEGSGFRRPTLKSRADALQTDPRNFKKRWQYQYEKFVLPLMTELDIELASINRKIG